MVSFDKDGIFVDVSIIYSHSLKSRQMGLTIYSHPISTRPWREVAKH
jgi:hypothetical protein